MNALSLGIDPGHEGGLAWTDLTTGELVDLQPMPTTKGRAGTQIDDVRLVILVSLYASRTKVAVVEDNETRPGLDAGAIHKGGKACGKAEIIPMAFYIPTYKVPPSVWKVALGLSSDKEKSVLMAERLWPTWSFRAPVRRKGSTGKLWDGLAEAAILSKWGARYL